MVKKVGSLMHLILIAALFLTGCAASPDAKAANEPLKVEYTFWEGDYTLLIAKEKGFFEKHGVQVEPIHYRDNSYAMSDMAINRVDIGLFSLGEMLALTRVANVRAVAVYDSGGTESVVSRRDVRSISDLRGKRVGVDLGSTGELLLREMLSSASMSVLDIELVDANPETVPQRLSEDDLAAGYVYAPYGARAVRQGNKTLYSAGAGHTLFPNVVVFREAVLQERPQDVQAFIDAWFEAVEYRLANPNECDQIIANKTGKRLEDVALSSGVQLFTRAESLAMFDQDAQNPKTLYYSAKLNLDFLALRGSLNSKPDLQTVLDPSFLQ